MHLAADLLDPDLDLDTGDIPEDLPEPSLEPQNETSARPLGRVGDYEFVSRFQGSDMTDVFLANKSSKFGFVRRAVVPRRYACRRVRGERRAIRDHAALPQRPVLRARAGELGGPC